MELFPHSRSPRQRETVCLLGDQIDNRPVSEMMSDADFAKVMQGLPRLTREEWMAQYNLLALFGDHTSRLQR